MRYGNGRSARRGLIAAVSLTVAATLALGAPASALAITRDTILKRGKSWVVAKVPYSQRRYYHGYRQDCSGFVSMAWKLNTSYTTRSIHAKAKRISVKRLKPGDAVLNPGHVVLFVKWKNKRAGTFYAYEEPSSGKTARRAIKKLRSGSKAYRRNGITAAPKPKPKPTPSPAPAPVPSIDPTMPPEAAIASAEPVAVATAPESLLR